jgi:hypothetical protein
LLFALGFQAVALPVDVDRAAILFLVCPPIEVNWPPAYIVELSLDNVSARTMPFPLGFQAVARPVDVDRAAILFLVWPPIEVKSPPAYIVELSLDKVSA